MIELLQREFYFVYRKMDRLYGEYLLIQKVIYRFHPKPSVVQLTLNKGEEKGERRTVSES